MNDKEPFSDSIMGDLFEYRGIVCQLVYRYPWYVDPKNIEEERLWGAVIYMPDGFVIKMARIHETPEHAVRHAKREVLRIKLDETHETPCPTTDAATD